MNSCILDLESIGQEDRRETLFYASHSQLIFKQDSKIKNATCDEEIQAEIPLPIDHTYYECVEFDSEILFIFGGKDVVVFDKEGGRVKRHRLDPVLIGRCITKAYKSGEDCIIFGVKQNNRIHLLRYDFRTQKRIAQTSSWDLSTISDLRVEDGIAYIILENSFLAICDMKTGETTKIRFETGNVNRSIFKHGDSLLFPCKEALRILTPSSVKTGKIPLVRIHSLECVIGNNLFLTSAEGRNLCCYNLRHQAISWELFGDSVIAESILIKGQGKDSVCDVLAVRTSDYVGFVNLHTGKNVGYVKCSHMYRIRQTGDHLLINRSNGTTTLVPGIQDELD